jgi:hypothetical protein
MAAVGQDIGQQHDAHWWPHRWVRCNLVHSLPRSWHRECWQDI